MEMGSIAYESIRKLEKKHGITVFGTLQFKLSKHNNYGAQKATVRHGNEIRFQPIGTTGGSMGI